MEQNREQHYQNHTPTQAPNKAPTKDDGGQEKAVDPFLVYVHRSTFNPTQTFFFNSPNRAEGFRHILQELLKSTLPDKDYLESYLRHMYRRMNKLKTIHNTHHGIGYFLSYLKNSSGRSIKEVTREDIESFVEQEQDRGLKLSTVRTRLMTVRAFIRFLVDQDELHHDVLGRRLMIKLPDSLPKAIAPDDMKLFLSGFANVRDKAMFLLLIRTGMRIGELLSTKIADLCCRDRKILIYQAQKTGSGRVVYYSDDAAAALDQWLAQRDVRKQYLFYGRGNKPLGYSAARMVFRKHLKKVGLSHKSYTGHCLRHTFASELLNAGMRLECLQKLLGHTSIEVTRKYARLTDKTRKDEYFKAMHKIERGEIDGDY